MTTERFSLYSVIIVSPEPEAPSPCRSPHENSKIALPAAESATLRYLAVRFPIGNPSEKF